MSARPIALAALWLLAACAGPAASTAPAAPPATAGRQATPAKAPPAPAPAAEARRLFADAVAAAEKKEPRTAADWEALARKWQEVAEASDLPEAWFNLGVCRERAGRREEAARAYRLALERQPRFGEAAANLALLGEPEDPRAALGYWSDLLRRFPDDSVARARLAALHERAGRQDEALRLAREAMLRDPRSTAGLKVAMRVAMHRKNLDLANLYAVRGQKLDPADPEIQTALGRIVLARGDEAGAVALWRKAAQSPADPAPARAELLRLEVSKQRWSGVAEQARVQLRAEPDDARAQLLLGVASRYLGSADQAAAAYDAAERLSGGRLPEVHLNRAVLLARVQDRCEPALAELRRYQVAAGPAALTDGSARKLEKECEQVLAAGRAAEEEARRMKAEAEQQKPGAEQKAAPGPGR